MVPGEIKMRILLVTLTSICAGCAVLPSKSDLDGFAAATSSSAKTVAAAVSASNQVATDQDEQLQAIQYIRGGRYALVELPQSKLTNRLDADQLQIRLAAISDLQNYANAVGKAADQELSINLRRRLKS